MALADRALEFICLGLLLIVLAVAPRYWGGMDLASFAALQIVASVALILYGARFLVNPQLTWRRNPFSLPLLVVLISGLLSMLDTSYWRASLHEMLRLLTVAGLFYLTAQLCTNSQRAASLMSAIVLGGAWAGIQGIIEQKTSADLAWRPFSFFISQNLFAGYLMLALPMAVGVLFYLRGWIQRRLRNSPHLLAAHVVADILPVLAGLSMLYALGLTGSKGGWLAFLLALIAGFVAWLRFSPQVRAAQRRWLVLASVVVLIGIVFISIPLRVRLSGMFRGEQANSTMFRWFTWKGAAAMAVTHPFNGVGIGAFEYIYPKYAQTGFTRAAHQSYLQFAAETGILGGIAFVGCIASVLALTWKRLPLSPIESRPLVMALLVGVVGFALHNLVDYSWNVTAVTLTFFISAAILSNECLMSSVKWKIPYLPDWTVDVGRWTLRTRRQAFLFFSLFCLLMNATIQRQVAAASARTDSDLRLKINSVTTATQEAQRAVALDRSAWENHVQLAYCYTTEYVLTRDDAAKAKAIKAYERAIALVPTDARPYKRLADFWRELHDLLKERDALTRALRQNPNDVGVLVRRGGIELELKNRNAARADFLRVAQLADAPYGRYPALSDVVDIGFARAYLHLGEMEREDKRYAEAERWLNEGLNVTQRAVEKERQFWQKLRKAGVLVPREAASLSDIRELRSNLFERLVAVYKQSGNTAKARAVTERAEKERAEADE
jgi:O-antigen ligase/tetratricopeptide (TPR) repeat protein